ncbi:MAG: S9 family peptidase [Candidatus Sericytochromatia bacterium]
MSLEKLLPPVAKIKTEEFIYNNEVYKDDYAWLKDKTNPEVIEYLEQENAYTKKMLEHTEALQEKLYKELLGRIKETDSTVPEYHGGFYYYSRTEAGKQYRIYCRKKDSLDAEEQIILDLNEIAKGKDYTKLGIYKISPNHKYLAYSLDHSGYESFTLFFKNIETGELLEEQIENTCVTAEWTSDTTTFFYSTLDSTQRPDKVFSHKLGSKVEEDKLLYHEKDEAFYVNISKSNDNNYIFITMVSKTTSEAYYFNCKKPDNEIKLIEARKKDLEYYVEHKDGFFYIVNNYDNALNFKVSKVSVEDPSQKNWVDFIPHNDKVRVDFIHVMNNYFIIYERSNGLKHIRIKNDTVDYYIDFPEPVYTFEPAKNRDFNSNILRFHYDSLTTPESVYDFNMETKERELKKRYEVLGGYNPDDYQTERLFAPANDGTLIPISVVYKKGMERNGNNNLYLYGYGSYEISIDPTFSSNRISLLDRGLVYAIAHIRGGGDMGREWYENGKFLKKKNTFTDFINCAEFLVKEKYTNPEKMVIMGGSAGGLLMGAVTNMRPDLFKAVIAHVPFVDVINTMMDPSLPLTVIEYDEWGNPNEKQYFDYMKSYAPYENVEAKDYPQMFVTGGLNDPRVGYWEPAKWVAKLRRLKTDNNRLLMKIKMGAGHGGASGRYDYLKDIAEEFSFIFDTFGIKE